MAWTDEGSCNGSTPTPVQPYELNAGYKYGDMVTNLGKQWRCKAVWPDTFRCGQAGYTPGEPYNGVALYEDVWEETVPTASLSHKPSHMPSLSPSMFPSTAPSDVSSTSHKPSLSPSESPSNVPSSSPRFESPSTSPSEPPSNVPSVAPSNKPSLSPSESPSTSPSEPPSSALSESPSDEPSLSPSESKSPSNVPSAFPSETSTPTETCGATTSVWSQLGSDINGELSHDNSGSAVALSANGKIIAIGAPNNDGDTGNFHAQTGHVRVYEIDESSQRVQLGGDIDGVNVGDQVGGFGLSTAVSLSADGMRVAVGSENHDGPAGDMSGHVRVFEYTASLGWTQLGQDIYGALCGEKLGWSVSLSADGNRVAVSLGRNTAGKVRVYELNASSQWVQLGEDMNGVTNGDSLGYSVALSDDGNIVAAGAPFSDANGANSGEVRVFQYTSPSGWSQLGQGIYGTTSEERSGWAVALSSDGKTVAIGEMLGNADNSGRVRVFEYASSTWEQLGGDIDGEATNDWTGFAVALSDNGKRVATGAPNANGANSGQARVFEYCASGGWTQLGLDIDGGHAEEIGRAVALSADGEIVATGGPFGVGYPEGIGRVRVYELSSS